MSKNPKTSRPSKGSITENGTYSIDLTGPLSHKLVITDVGEISIGPASMGKKVDLQVEPDDRIDWTVFEPFACRNGDPFPPWLKYIGSDTGFFEWARKRPIHSMTWTPILHSDRRVDASHSHVYQLLIQLDRPGGHLHLCMPRREIVEHFRLIVSGDLTRFSADGDAPEFLLLRPHTGRLTESAPYLLPELGVLHQVTTLVLDNKPMAQPISLKGLNRFINLEDLDLSGNFSDLDQLTHLPELRSLFLRDMTDLQEMPALSLLPKLNFFSANNVEEAGGKRLRAQMKARAVTAPWRDCSGVTQLRKPEWFEREYGRPFSQWPTRLAKLGNQAYDSAFAALEKASNLADAQAAFTSFAARFNNLKSIQTPEREDLALAVDQLSQSKDAQRLGVTNDMALAWFDAVRDY